jgi:hypothetical protein
MAKDRGIQSGDKLFVFEERGDRTAGLGQLRWVELSAAYKYAADHVADAAIKGTQGKCADLYPIVFLYRHFMELELKSLLALSLIGSGKEDLIAYAEKVLKDHNPERLLNCLISQWKDCEYLEVEELTALTTVVKELAVYDPTSTAFRYSVTKSLLPVQVDLQGLSVTNLRDVAQRFAETCLLLRDELLQNADGYSDCYESGPQLYVSSEDEMLAKELDGRMEEEAQAEEFDSDFELNDD